MKRDMGILKEEQLDLAGRVSLAGAFDDLTEINSVAGADISCGRFSKRGYAAVVVFSYPTLEILETSTAAGDLQFPYIPGYLAFREAPLLEECISRLANLPDVLICDGQGIAHQRRCGIASHIGVKQGLATIGCAKSRLIGEYEEPGVEKGSRSDLRIENKKIGEVLRSKTNVKPLFISPGHRIGFEQSSELVLSLCGKYRLPETTRAAHRLVNELRVGDQD